MLTIKSIKSNQIKFNADHKDPYIREERKEKGKKTPLKNASDSVVFLRHCARYKIIYLLTYLKTQQ